MKTRLGLVVVTALCVAGLSGCFTVSHSEYPDVRLSQAPESRDCAVTLAGFEAAVTTYSAVYGYETGWQYAPGFYRHGRYHGGGLYPATYSTTTYIPQTSMSTAFIKRAQDALERSGYRVAATGAPYRVEVTFSGPAVTDGDRTKEVLWLLCTAFTADYGTQTWSAQLRIYDTASGRLLMGNDYTQRYYALVWGPIPIFSPAGSDQTNYNTMMFWSLNALTDRAMADATAFLATAK